MTPEMKLREAGLAFVTLVGVLLCGCDSDLHDAARKCDANRISVLLAHGAQADGKDQEGFTPLHRAAYAGCGVPVVSLLLQYGADANARDSHNRTPLHLSFIYSQLPYDVQDALLQSGADVNAQDDKGDTPLHLAAWRGNPKSVRKLLDHGANHRIVNFEGLAPVELAQKSYKKDNATSRPSQLLKDTQVGRLKVIELLELQ